MARDEKPPKQGPLWLSVLSVALIVTGVVVTLAATQRLQIGAFGSPPPNSLRDARTVIAASAGLLHPRDLAISPDGAHFATIAELAPCHHPDHGLPSCGHSVAVYDSQTATLTQSLAIEPLLGLALPTADASKTPTPASYVQLSGLGWSPDSSWFAAVYTVFDTPNPASPNDVTDSGLLLVNPQSGAKNIVRGDSGVFGRLGDSTASHPIWDVQQGIETLGYTVQPGVVFAWGKNGLPFTTQPATSAMTELPVNAGARYPVGQPDGLAPFTIWQPGVVVGPGSSPVTGGRSEFVTTFASWATDGRHVSEFTLGAALPTPARAASIVSADSGTSGPEVAAPATLPDIPARDVALAHVQEEVGAFGWAEVAWNVAGTKLASVTCFARHGARVEVRDTTSGAIIGSASIKLAPGDPGCADPSTQNLRLAWAPDASQLLISDSAANSIFIWTVVSNPTPRM